MEHAGAPFSQMSGLVALRAGDFKIMVAARQSGSAQAILRTISTGTLGFACFSYTDGACEAKGHEHVFKSGARRAKFSHAAAMMGW